ncbi:hypothetical protein Rhe02_75530 [Rhizocola hellebori]|uniref:Uncharacterized protein n=1 Tax=Rhizocola hellebori TaxID=1392758 RepID=A0A8J3QHP1_9ACTN|nr:hypothetical protein [Rhizocola hellebori]GIH09486.1 hypothetical protein Rhe02_75530 [Rhizocola hellebori]
MIWTQMLVDPTVPVDRDTLRMVVDDQRRWTRRWLYPMARVFSRVAVAGIRVLKAVAPFRAHRTMDRLCVWFLQHFVSPTAGALLVRHFLVETNLLNFLVRNTAIPGLPEVTLRPTTVAQLGDRAVIKHDLNVYDVLIALGVSRWRKPEHLDFSMLKVEKIEVGGRRWLNLDIQTALCLMNIPFAFCLTRKEYQTAVHSLRLDESILALLADLTGDERFLRWRPGTIVVRADSGMDVPKAVYEHAVICEYAHAHLRRLAADALERGSTEPALA